MIIKYIRIIVSNYGEDKHKYGQESIEFNFS